MSSLKHGTKRFTGTFEDDSKGKADSHQQWISTQYKGWISEWAVKMMKTIFEVFNKEPVWTTSVTTNNKHPGLVGIDPHHYYASKRQAIYGVLTQSEEFVVDKPISIVANQSNSSHGGTDNIPLFCIYGDNLNVKIHVETNVYIDFKPSDGYGKDTLVSFCNVMGNNTKVEIILKNGARFDVSDTNRQYGNELVAPKYYDAMQEVDGLNAAYKHWCLWYGRGTQVTIRRE